MPLVETKNIQSDLTEVGAVCEYFANLIAPGNGKGNLNFRVNIALTEALNNAIIHGCKNDDRHQISIEYEQEASKHIFHIYDPGCGPCNLEIPSVINPPDLLSENSRGNIIIHWAADEVLHNISSTGFCLTLMFRSNDRRE